MTDDIKFLSVEETGCPTHLSYEASGAWLMSWCKANNAGYYAAPKEDFFLWKAEKIAREKGYRVMVVENMS